MRRVMALPRANRPPTRLSQRCNRALVFTPVLKRPRPIAAVFLVQSAGWIRTDRWVSKRSVVGPVGNESGSRPRFADRYTDGLTNNFSYV